ncbi:reverse transcriptase domain-containing protein [Clostridium tagluense]|uniref:reverse transcriptase domain-containing protein n=1 Tax=Clostridium tagluense TaxID=360422 RepID=UPI00216237E4|nr:reverse transcriptase domain-containing protein [Clostridium tagluense]
MEYNTIQYNIEKARLDGKVQNIASYINETTLKAIHKKMDENKAKGIDKVAKEDYSVNLEANVENLVKRMKSGSYKPEPIRRVYIPKDGIMEDGKYLESDKGTPQGNGASPILANVYLHYVLDYWFDVKIKRQCKGEAYLIRYCDDFVCCFQNKWEAEGFYHKLIVRFKEFGLELALEKTKILEFGRFARQNR